MKCAYIYIVQPSKQFIYNDIINDDMTGNWHKFYQTAFMNYLLSQKIVAVVVTLSRLFFELLQNSQEIGALSMKLPQNPSIHPPP